MFSQHFYVVYLLKEHIESSLLYKIPQFAYDVM